MVKRYTVIMDSCNLRIPYGKHLDQFCEVHVPVPSSEQQYPVVIVIHGGFFKSKWNIDNSGVRALLKPLLKLDLAVCLVEYRRVGNGGGFPSSNEDIVAALNILVAVDGIDINRSAILGHSAGGTLAIWACCEAPLKRITWKPRLCVALAPIGNLCEGQRWRLSDEGDAIINYMMGALPSSAGEEALDSTYRQASPHYLLPIEVPIVVATGLRDSDVPADLVRDFVSSLGVGSDVKALEFEDADHYDIIDPSSRCWSSIAQCLTEALL